MNFSGTTAVVVLIKDGYLTCGNLGDSRAVVGCLRSTNELGDRDTLALIPGDPGLNWVWVAHALSRDHKPDSRDEKERILLSGGRVG